MAEGASWMRQRRTYKLFVGNGEYRDAEVFQHELMSPAGDVLATVRRTGTSRDNYPVEWETSAGERGTAGTVSEAKAVAEGRVYADRGPKYPEVEVKLVGEDSNAFSMASRTRSALKRAGVPEAECEAFFTEALGGDYWRVIATIMRWVTVS